MSAIAPVSPAPADALRALAADLRAEDSVVSPHVVDPTADAALGVLAASGPRAAADPASYAIVFECVREGYLLHYGTGRVVVGADGDLALLAGDYLYALGLERLASLGDLEAVRELSDLISLAAQVHDRGGASPRAKAEVAALWLGCATSIAAGATPAHEAAKAALRTGSDEAARALWAAAGFAAAEAGIGEHLGHGAASLDFLENSISTLG